MVTSIAVAAIYLKKNTDRSARLEATARDLLAEGLLGEALDHLASGARTLNRHEEEAALPCLCGRCGFRGFEAQVDGEDFVRDFVVHWGRVLHFWAPAALVDQRGRAQLRELVLARLSGKRSAPRRTRPVAPPGYQPPNSKLDELLALPFDDGEIPF